MSELYVQTQQLAERCIGYITRFFYNWAHFFDFLAHFKGFLTFFDQNESDYEKIVLYAE